MNYVSHFITPSYRQEVLRAWFMVWSSFIGTESKRDVLFPFIFIV